RFFQKNHVNYYPTSVGAAYKELFKRDAFACLSFYDKDNNQYYLYFNAAYNRDINRMVFSHWQAHSLDLSSTAYTGKRLPRQLYGQALQLA
ncbi:MAG: hypothetical protein IJ987_00860, partial [Firmicutes bacterium]|nr:hypothetical protein [Bacillota bacterium]